MFSFFRGSDVVRKQCKALKAFIDHFFEETKGLTNDEVFAFVSNHYSEVTQAGPGWIFRNPNFSNFEFLLLTSSMESGWSFWLSVEGRRNFYGFCMNCNPSLPSKWNAWTSNSFLGDIRATREAKQLCKEFGRVYGVDLTRYI